MKLNRQELLNGLQKIYRYKIELFIVFVLLIFGFLFYRIATLGQAQPSQSSISLQSTKFKKAGINPNIITKIQQLQNNSVNVQALFNQSRQNPFNE